MTSERKLLFKPSDIELIEFVCKACSASLGLDPSKDNHFIKRECPNCGTEWMVQQSMLHQAATALFRSVHTLIEMENEARFKMRLHLHDESKQLVSQKLEQAQ